MSFCLTKITSFSPSLCYSVFKKHLPPFVIMSFCLQKNICLPLSLCHSVFKKHLSPFVIMPFCLQKNICLSFSLCHYVFKKHLSLSVTLSFCLQKKHLPPFVIMSFCLQKNICLSFSLCHYVGHQRIQNLDKTVQKNRKEGASITTHPPLLCYYLEEEVSSQRPFYIFPPFVMYFIAMFISLAITFASRWRSSLSFPCK